MTPEKQESDREWLEGKAQALGESYWPNEYDPETGYVTYPDGSYLKVTVELVQPNE